MSGQPGALGWEMSAHKPWWAGEVRGRRGQRMAKGLAQGVRGGVMGRSNPWWCRPERQQRPFWIAVRVVKQVNSA
jgi:hypothetical protein